MYKRLVRFMNEATNEKTSERGCHPSEFGGGGVGAAKRDCRTI
jgi:hypothetical protein